MSDHILPVRTPLKASKCFYVISQSDDISRMQRNADVLLNACKDIGLAVNPGKTKYMKSNKYEKVKIFKY